jgi:hypothetical protein
VLGYGVESGLTARSAEEIDAWVNIWPGRPSVRLETEVVVVRLTCQPPKHAHCCGLLRWRAVPDVMQVTLRLSDTMLTQIEDLDRGPKSLNVIHNYGHGTSGMALHWGCAGDVVAMAKPLLGVI